MCVYFITHHIYPYWLFFLKNCLKLIYLVCFGGIVALVVLVPRPFCDSVMYY